MEHMVNFLESHYYQHQGFDSVHLARVRAHYLQFVQDRSFVVELGCGRGEFLDEVRALGKRTLGVDIDPGMIASTRERGLEAVEQDVIEFLETTDEEPDLVFAAHLVEHLSVEDSLALFSLACGRLQPNGLLVVVTPNPQCLAIILSDFWNDPTHVRPYTPALLEFLAKEAGLEVVESAPNPTDVPGPPPELRVPDTLPSWGELEPNPLPPWVSEQLDVGDGPTREALYGLLQRLYDVNYALLRRIEELENRIDHVRHQAHVASAGVNSFLEHHYGPNEIYLVARRPG
ncbi:MAG: class I SAM-dependent methyltransferase [Actinomycetota bacterium]